MDKEKAVLMTKNNDYSVAFVYSDSSEVIGRTIVLYESPYTDGAFADDTGAAPRRFSFTAKFRGVDYLNHLEFAQQLSTYNKSWQLKIPNYVGVFNGAIERATISHNNSRTACSVNIDFVEVPKKSYARPLIIHVESNTYETSREVIAANKAALEETAENTDNVSWLALLEERVARLEAISSEIAAPARSISASVSTAQSLVGRMSSAVMGTVEAYIAAAESLISTPELVASVALQINAAINTVISSLELPVEMIERFRTSAAVTYAALSGAYIARRLQTDNDARNAQASYEAVDSWTDEGEFIPPRGFDSASAMTPEYLSSADLQSALYMQADLTEKAAKLARANDEDDENCRQLAKQMRTISDFIHNMMLQTGNIKEIDLGDEEIPLFILLMREGLSYKAADRVHALNPHIEDPIFYTGKVRIYAK